MISGCGEKEKPHSTLRESTQVCVERYSPIPVDFWDSPTTTFDKALSNGWLKFSSAENYFEILDRGVIQAQLHTKSAVLNGEPEIILNRNNSKNGFGLIDSGIVLPIAMSGDFFNNHSIFSRRFSIEASSEQMSSITKRDDSFRMEGSPDEILKKQGVNDYRLYQVSETEFELRVERITLLDANENRTLKQRVLIRYRQGEKLSPKLRFID